MNILIKNVQILSMDDNIGTIDNGFIGISDDRFAFVSKDLDDAFSPDYIIDGTNKVALPGLINTHSHIPMTLLRGYSDGYPLQTWLYEKIFPIEDKLNGDFVYWGTMLGCAEMLMSGTTAFADMYFFIDDIAKATAKSGLRANLSRGLMNLGIEGNFSENEKVIETIDAIKKWNNAQNGRIKVDISTHSAYTSSQSFLSSIAELTEKNNLGMQVHISETEAENAEIFEKYKKTPTKFLYDLGYFKTRTIASHCVYLSDEDIQILSDNNVTIAHNPTSNLKLGSGIAPIRKYLNKGINVSLGTDGASSNNNLNMLEEMNLAALLSLGTNKNPALISADECLKMATINGAKALGADDIGKLNKGSKADMILIDTDKPHFYPKHNMKNNILYSANGGDVDTVIVDGNILMEKRELKTIDFEEIKFNVGRVCKELFK